MNDYHWRGDKDGGMSLVMVVIMVVIMVPLMSAFAFHQTTRGGEQ